MMVVLFSFPDFQWLSLLRQEYPTILFKASTQSQRSHLGRNDMDIRKANSSVISSNVCLGADSVLQLLKNYCRNNGVKTAITVGVIGYPNVGKSSFINSLKRSRAVGVSSTAGYTRAIQVTVAETTHAGDPDRPQHLAAGLSRRDLQQRQQLVPAAQLRGRACGCWRRVTRRSWTTPREWSSG